MLAEIFLLKLEFLLRTEAAKRALAHQARFVPITLPFGFKTARARA